MFLGILALYMKHKSRSAITHLLYVVRWILLGNWKCVHIVLDSCIWIYPVFPLCPGLLCLQVAVFEWENNIADPLENFACDLNMCFTNFRSKLYHQTVGGLVNPVNLVDILFICHILDCLQFFRPFFWGSISLYLLDIHLISPLYAQDDFSYWKGESEFSFSFRVALCCSLFIYVLQVIKKECDNAVLEYL